MYSNPESWKWTDFSTGTQSGIGPVHPFSTNALNSGTEFQDFLFAAAFPFLSFRIGLGGSFSFSWQNGLAIASEGGTQSEWTRDETIDYDDAVTGTVGDRDYRITNSESYTNYTAGTDAAFGVGGYLGFIGISVFGNAATAVQRVSGVYQNAFSFAPAEYTPGADYVTDKTVYYGPGEMGALANFPTNSSMEVGANVQLVLPLTIELPIVASGIMMTQTGPPLLGDIPQTVTINTMDPTGGTGANDTATWSYTEGAASNDYNVESGVISAPATNLLFSNLPAAGVSPGLADAADLENSNNSMFGFELGVFADPMMPLVEQGVFNARLAFRYGLTTWDMTEAAFRSESYTGPETATSTPAVYSYNRTYLNPSTSSYSVIGFEAGGVFSFFNEEKTVEIEAGAIYGPEFTSGSIVNGPEVTIETFSYTDGTVTAPTAETDDIGPAPGFRGRKTIESTIISTNNGKDNTSINNIYIPVATRFTLFKGLMQIINGYMLHFETTKTFQSTADRTVLSPVETVWSDPAGGNANLVATTDATNVTSTTINGTVNETFAANWYGYMNFMIRLMLIPELTIDLFGQSIMQALNFDLHFTDSGAPNPAFNLFNFFSLLGIAVTLYIP